MKNTIDEMWYGNLQPSEAITPTDEMRTLSKHITNQIAALRDELSEDGKATLEKLVENFYESGTLLSHETFRYAFRLGANLMLEIRTDEENY